MRIFNTMDETPQNGISVATTDGTDYYVARHDVVIARVTPEHLIHMLGNADAAISPTMSWTTRKGFGNDSGYLGGITIYRADWRLKEGSLWLVPSNLRNLEVLHFMRNENDSEYMKCTDAAVLASMRVRSVGGYFHVATLSPGGSVRLTPQAEPVPGIPRKFNTVVDSVVSNLSTDGHTINFNRSWKRLHFSY